MKQKKARNKRNNFRNRIKAKNGLFKLYGINCAGIKSKITTFNDVLKRVQPKIWTLQETKLKNNESISCEALGSYQVYYRNRQESHGGGIALGVAKDLKSTLVKEGDNDTEVISVKVFLKDIELRVITAYGPQENDLKVKKEKFWEFIEEEINNAELAGDGVIIQMDGNLHAGRELVKGDPNIRNQNGKYFCEFLDRNPQLIVVNSLDLCEGIITRKRVVEQNIEQAVLDFIIINDKVQPFLRKMKIDEEKEMTLINLAQMKKNKKMIETDHNAMILELDLEIENKKTKREEIFNIKNKICQQAFFVETESNKELLGSFENDLPFSIQSLKWKKTFKDILHKCFRKIRIVKKKNVIKTEQLLKERIKLKNEMRATIDDKLKQTIQERIDIIEDEIGEEVASENYRIVLESIENLGDGQDLNGLERQKLWKILKNKFPKNANAVPVGKKNSAGKVITEHEELKHLYLKTYKQRLRSRPMKNDLEGLKELKEELFEERLKIASEKKTKPWTMAHLESVLKGLKKNKARDPNGWANELFFNGIAGQQLKLPLLHILNKMKETNEIPDFIRMADICTIYKGKGSKNELINDRGVFLVTIIRSILMRLIYMDFYKMLDESMSDAQVGARKGKNIRNHIWIVNGIISDVLSTKTKKPIDIQIFDFKQCFDSLWLKECMNDLYEAGLNDDKFAILYNANSNVKIAIKTPVGITKRENIEDVIIQGDVLGPIFCSKQVETFSQECLEKSEYTYFYRGEVEIPPLSMVDDVLTISECGYRTSMVHGFMKLKTDSKKLQFGANKCKKMHIGKVHESFKCQTLKVDNWKELEVTNEETGAESIEDVLDGEIEMENIKSEKYLGDVISIDGKNIKNIKARVSKGIGISSRIISILEGIPFGHFYYQVGIILRNTLLISSLLCNSEAWYNVTNAELDLLESVDIKFLRNLLNARRSTPKEILYLETGCVPIREIIIKRRILFLHYIMNENENSMIHRFFQTQLKYRKKKDWISSVLKDLNDIGIEENIEEIKIIQKTTLKRIIDKAITEKAFKRLLGLKDNHSKVKNLMYSEFKLQNYLKPSRIKATRSEIQTIFELRSRGTEVKLNFRGKFENLECRVCEKSDESQKHAYECAEILKIRKLKKQKIEYENIFEENKRKQIQIAKDFKENMKILSKVD